METHAEIQYILEIAVDGIRDVIAKGYVGDGLNEEAAGPADGRDGKSQEATASRRLRADAVAIILGSTVG